MDFKFLSVDLSAVTFDGLSLSRHRKVALVATVAIWFGVGYIGYCGAIHLNAIGWADNVACLSLLAMVIHYILSGRFFMHSLARALVNVTPLGVLYRKDMVVLHKARAELLSIAHQVQFRDYIKYGKINPSVRSRGSLLVMAHQRKGDLQQWVEKAQNLKQLANLVYQIYLVEEILAHDQNFACHPI